MTRKIYLAGGYFAHANYGDVIQARAWINFYGQHGFDVALVHAAAPQSVKEFRHYLGGNFELIHHHRLLRGEIPIDGHDVFHLYGGGYLNSEWGESFSKLLRAFARRRVKLISTGTQVDRAWARTYQREIQNIADVQWLSVRDKYSQKCLGLDRSLICDDSFLYFLGSGRKQPPVKVATQSRQIIAHFNLSDYAVDPLFGRPPSSLDRVMKIWQSKKEPTRAMIENVVRNYRRQGYGLTILRNFPSLPDEVIEAERLFVNRELISQITLQNTFAVENERASFHFGISNSFHAAILMKVILNTPVYFLAFNEYYTQKAAALIEYGVVDEAHVIKRATQLGRLQGPEALPKETQESSQRMSERVEALKRAVLEAVGR